MKAAPFELHLPTTLDEAVQLLATYEDEAKLLAGGQSLVPVMALRLTRFDHLVDLNRVEGLRGVRLEGDHLVIGAMTRQADVLSDPLVATHAPLLARATALIGHFQIRNRGTLGGSLAHCDGAAEYPAAVLALDAELEATGSSGTRRIPATEFFVSAFTTALEPAEVLTAVRIPVARGRSGYAVEEMARRRGDFALAGAMCAVRLDSSDRVEHVALSLFGIGSLPVRATVAENHLRGMAASDVPSAMVATWAVDGVDPTGDIHASGSYRKRVAGTLAAIAVQRAMEEARRG